MELNDLMAIVHRAYPDGETRLCWNARAQRARAGRGDTLAEFVAREIAETFEAGATDRAQLADAVLAMHKAQGELDAVAKALERRLELYRREDAQGS